MSRESLRALYARAAVVAQFSRHEGFGVAAAEAAAMGCALVTTDLPVFDEVLGPARGRVALHAPDADVAAALRDALDAGRAGAALGGHRSAVWCGRADRRLGRVAETRGARRGTG